MPLTKATQNVITPNICTTDTTQTITGSKTFSNQVSAKALDVTNTSGVAFIEIGGVGNAFIDIKVPNADDNDIRIGTTGDGGYLSTGGNGDINLLPGGTGRVGIGTGSPQTILHIEGSASKQNIVTLTNTANAVGERGMRVAFDANPARLTVQRASDSGAFEANHVAIMQDTGRIGIGTIAPTEKLDVDGNVKCNSLIAAQNTITAGLTQIGLIGAATNVGMGAFSPLGKNTTGAANTALGVATLIEVITGSNNTAVGANALQNTTGGQNTGLGQQALTANTTGNLNTAVGAFAANIQTNFDNSGAFGYNAQPTGSNAIRIGNASVTSVTCQTNAWSDERDKTEIRDTVLGLDFIKALRPVDYKWDFREDYRELPPESPSIDATQDEINKYKQDLEKWREDSQLKNLVRDGSKKRTRFHHGLIAQEVKALIESTGIDFGGFQDSTIKGGDDVMTIGYQELIAPLVKAVQELSAKVAMLESK